MYPILLNLKNKKVIIIGGGKVAYRKAKNLEKTGCLLTIIAPHFCEEFQSFSFAKKKITEYDQKYLLDVQLILACTNSRSVNAQIVEDAEDWQWVNDCSNKQNSDFYNMNVLEDEEFLLGISSQGKDPGKTKQFKQKLKKILEEERKSR